MYAPVVSHGIRNPVQKARSRRYLTIRRLAMSSPVALLDIMGICVWFLEQDGMDTSNNNKEIGSKMSELE